MLRPSDCVPGCVLGVSCFSAPHVTVWGRGNSRLSFPVWSCLSMNDGRLMSLTEVTVGGQKHDVQLCVEHFPVTSNSKKKKHRTHIQSYKLIPWFPRTPLVHCFCTTYVCWNCMEMFDMGTKYKIIYRNTFTLYCNFHFLERTLIFKEGMQREWRQQQENRVLRETINFTALGCFLWKESGTDWTPLFLKLWGRFSHRGFGAVTHRAIPE